MSQALKDAIKANKALIDPETLKRIRGSMETLSEGAKAEMVTEINNAGYLKGMVDEYQNQCGQVLMSFDQKLKNIEEKQKQQFAKALKSAEAAEHQKVSDEVDQLLDDL